MKQSPEELGKALLSFIRGGNAEVHDWPGFRELALCHGVVGLVYPLLKSGEGRSALFHDYAREASNTVAHMAILSLLRKEGLVFLPMKGASLVARGLYLPQERPLLDIDILVRPDDIPRFARFLSSRGFSEVIASRKGLVMHKGKLNIDIHAYPVASELFVPPGKLWARSRGGFLSLQDELLVIAVHAAKSSFTSGPRLIWKQDAERLLPLVDLEKALGFARAVGLEACLARILFARDEDIIRGKRRPGRLRKLLLAWRAGANKGQKALCIARAGWERLKKN